MGNLTFTAPDSPEPFTVMAFGAHCDDIEIGAGGTLLALARRYPGMRLIATVMTSTPQREEETRGALPDFAPDGETTITVHQLTDGHLPTAWGDVKEHVEAARARHRGRVDLVLCPGRDDAHQDHRLLSKILPTVFRDHLVLEYEILKWDGDLGRPNTFVPLDEDVATEKIALLHKHYTSQHGKTWFDDETFRSLLRVRGIECNARYAEAFTARKIALSLT